MVSLRFIEVIGRAFRGCGEGVASGEESVPQRLKPHWERDIYGTAEAVPLSETGFSVACEAVPLSETETFSGFHYTAFRYCASHR